MPQAVGLSEEERFLYNSFVDKWYFADIGFDSDYEFIYRFNAIWKAEINRYLLLLSIEKEVGLNGEHKSVDSRSQRSGEDTIYHSGSKQTNHSKSGNDTFEKGVTTTSTQTTSNEGNKLSRTTPNEELTVEGSSNTTVKDSGSDVTRYATNENTVETPNLEDTHAYGSGYENSSDEKSVKLTADDYKKLVKAKSIATEFALCFEKLFMEVFE